MELNNTAVHAAPFGGTTAGGRARGFSPQNVRLLGIGVDFSLFVIAIVAVALKMGPESTQLYRLAQIFIGALLMAMFAVACLLTRLHEPRVLARISVAAHFLKAVVCFGAPPLLTLLICAPFLGNGDPNVDRLAAWLGYAAIAAAGVAVVSRIALFGGLAGASKRLVSAQRVAVVGSGEAAGRLIHWLEVTEPGLVEVIGVFDDRSRDRLAENALAQLIRGNTADLIELYKSAPFDKIVIALPNSAEDRVLHLLRRLRQLPVDIALAPDLIGFRSPNQGQSEIAGLKLYRLTDRPIRGSQRLLKGAIDRLLSAAALLFLSPLLLLVVLAIRLDSRGPILFRQPRQGLGDSLFQVYKFRTMRADLGDAIGRQQTQRDDPRVTRLGAWLRRTSIDELPQLLNVLRGEMSLVGPRPHTPHMLIGDKQIFDLVDEYSFRHRVKPGITGLAQVNGYRGAIDTPEHLRARIDYDLYYIDHWSLWLDFKILFRTAAICFTGVNAY
ncbi:undecaprenyl-phosphate glucose phosphotransferase [Dongia sedimenti]|uniref:Undecaprenyl-phosphate glucose phosphotransferase n=1 Tax=Dongia sedimenti TaxID=3064282 RepID=A0ABU0YR66_9PROT|nr:undecaprenyl-phosphate glucose phosphotransferase [Rhodospirillaceae bacterium R-7]